MGVVLHDSSADILRHTEMPSRESQMFVVSLYVLVLLALLSCFVWACAVELYRRSGSPPIEAWPSATTEGIEAKSWL
eukprot:4507751-Amphidinium_carterae.1